MYAATKCSLDHCLRNVKPVLSNKPQKKNAGKNDHFQTVFSAKHNESVKCMGSARKIKPHFGFNIPKIPDVALRCTRMLGDVIHARELTLHDVVCAQETFR